MTDAELLPCPFCGGSAKFAHTGFHNSPVICADNGCCQALSATAWNRRAALDVPADDRNAVADKCFEMASDSRFDISPAVRAQLIGCAQLLRTPPAVTEAMAWVIERDIHSTLHYWGGRSSTDWWKQHEQALRFARSEDAQLMLTYHCGGIGRVAQHIWVNK